MDLAGEEQYRVSPNIPPHLRLTETQVILTVDASNWFSCFSCWFLLIYCYCSSTFPPLLILSLQKYVREQILLAVAVIVKRGSLDKTINCKSIFHEVSQLISSGNPTVVSFENIFETSLIRHREVLKNTKHNESCAVHSHTH